MTSLRPLRRAASGSPKHLLVGTIDAQNLVNLTNHWDIIIVSGASITGNMTIGFSACRPPPCSEEFDLAFRTELQKRIELNGGNILLSLDFGERPMTSPADVDKVVSSIQFIIQDYHFNGIDFDLQTSSLGGCSDSKDFAQPQDSATPLLISLMQKIRAAMGPGFLLSMPVEIYVDDTGALTSINGCPSVIYGLRDVLNFTVAIMYHLTQGDPETDYVSPTGKSFLWNTADHWAAAADTLLGAGTVEGPPSLNSTLGFAGLRPEQMYVFCNNPTPTFFTLVINALNCITRATDCGEYKPRMAFPFFAGFHLQDIWVDETQLGNDFYQQIRSGLSDLDAALTSVSSTTTSSPTTSTDNGSSSTTSSSSDIPSQPAQRNGSPNTVVIVVPIVLGIFAILCLVFAIRWYRARLAQRDVPQAFVAQPASADAEQPTVAERKHGALVPPKIATPQSQTRNQNADSHGDQDIGELRSALNTAGFSIGALVTSLRRVGNEGEGGAPPMYPGSVGG